MNNNDDTLNESSSYHHMSMEATSGTSDLAQVVDEISPSTADTIASFSATEFNAASKEPSPTDAWSSADVHHHDRPPFDALAATTAAVTAVDSFVALTTSPNEPVIMNNVVSSPYPSNNNHHQWLHHTAAPTTTTDIKSEESSSNVHHDAATAAAAAIAHNSNGVGVIQDPLAAYHASTVLNSVPTTVSQQQQQQQQTAAKSKSTPNSNSCTAATNKQITWDQRLEDLKAYRKEHGHCNVPQRWKKDRGLGVWIKTQRSNYRRLKDGKPSSLTAERIQALTALGFEWELGKNYEVIAWEDRLVDLNNFKQAQGHCNVPQRWKENRGLGVWIKTQRSYYRKFKERKPTSLTAERVQILASMGFEWEIANTSENATWNSRLEALKKFKEKHGHCNVPQRYKEDRSLGTWIKTQRSHFKLWKEGKPSRMTPMRIHELSIVGFEFELIKV